ncbi:MAG: hypothetical protein ACYDD1_18965 [Caulobacteraceae bacterium]
MAKPIKRKLKVFQAQLGFYDSVVAAASQAAALRAWGVHQNLFADGQARLTDDAQAMAAALAHPDTPLQRAIGSAEPFVLEPTPPKPPPASKAKVERSKPAKPPAKQEVKPAPKPQPAADRSALDAAEAALSALEADSAAQEAAFRRRQDELDTARKAARTAQAAALKTAQAALASTRDAYRKAGGKL